MKLFKLCLVFSALQILEYNTEIEQEEALYKKHYTCEEIEKGAFLDTILYKKITPSTGKLIFTNPYGKNKLFEVWIHGKSRDYVTEPLKTYLEKSIKENGCEGLEVKPIRTAEEMGVKINKGIQISEDGSVLD